VSVNIPEIGEKSGDPINELLKENHVLIKTWAENEGIVEDLVNQGIVAEVGSYEGPHGVVTVVGRVLVDVIIG